MSATLSEINILIYAVYLPPLVSIKTLNKSFGSIKYVLESHLCESIILGDFNIGFVHWTKDSVGQLNVSNYSSTLGFSLVDFMSMNNLIQFNHVKNVNDRILDLVLSKFTGVSVKRSLDILSKLDSHHPASTSYYISAALWLLNQQFATHTSKKADYFQVNAMLGEVDWLSELSSMEDVNLIVNRFYNILQTIIESKVPKTKRRNNRCPYWFPQI